MSSQLPATSHSFDTDLASALGSVDLAILINHFSFWIKINEKNNVNLQDGRYWTYQSRSQILSHFYYWSEQHLKTLIKNLVAKKILIKGNYNKFSSDRTCWYAIDMDELLKLTNGRLESTNPLVKTNQSTLVKTNQAIPDTKEDAKKEIYIAYGKFVKFSQEQYDKLISMHGKPKVDDIIQSINDYCVNHKPKGYKDYECAFRTFEKNYKSKTQGFNSPADKNKEYVKSKFTPGLKYNGAMCHINDESIAFERGYKHKQLKFNVLGFSDQFDSILRFFEISPNQGPDQPTIRFSPTGERIE